MTMLRKVLTSTISAAALTVAAGSMYAPALAQSGTKATTPPAATTATSAATRTFVHDMAVAGNAEVQLGQLAEQHAANGDVKAFGEMMVKDHTKANDELKPIAQKLGVTLPTELDAKHKALYDKLSKLQGAAFDREYMNAMVQGHTEVLAKLKAHTGATSRTTSMPSSSSTPAGASAQQSVSGGGSASGSDQELTSWARTVEPTVQTHLDRAKEVQQKVK